MRLEGRTALVTGGASGIGAATARRLAAEGARVAVADIAQDAARDLAAELDGVAITLDVLDIEAIEPAVASCARQLGGIDILVNNAGGGNRGTGFFTEIPAADWAYQLRLNLDSVLGVTQAVLPGMKERGGSIVNVASEAGRVGSQFTVPYSAAKAGVIGFTKAIAREYARFGVRCNAVAPGPIETPLLSALVEIGGEMGARFRQGMIDSTAMRRPGRPEEVAATIAFLASDDAAFITGETVGVSGGLGMI